MRKNAKNQIATNLGGGFRLFPREPPKVAPKILNRSPGLESPLFLDRGCRKLMGESFSLNAFSLTLSTSLSRTVGDERGEPLGGEPLEREDEFKIEVADS